MTDKTDETRRGAPRKTLGVALEVVVDDAADPRPDAFEWLIRALGVFAVVVYPVTPAGCAAVATAGLKNWLAALLAGYFRRHNHPEPGFAAIAAVAAMRFAATRPDQLDLSLERAPLNRRWPAPEELVASAAAGSCRRLCGGGAEGGCCRTTRNETPLECLSA